MGFSGCIHAIKPIKYSSFPVQKAEPISLIRPASKLQIFSLEISCLIGYSKTSFFKHALRMTYELSSAFLKQHSFETKPNKIHSHISHSIFLAKRSPLTTLQNVKCRPRPRRNIPLHAPVHPDNHTPRPNLRLHHNPARVFPPLTSPKRNPAPLPGIRRHDHHHDSRDRQFPESGIFIPVQDDHFECPVESRSGGFHGCNSDEVGGERDGC